MDLATGHVNAIDKIKENPELRYITLEQERDTAY